MVGYGEADAIRHKFTGKERDAETGLDYFGARYMSSAQARFTTPDPLMASAKASNPQTWNRYAYTLNNPLRFVDPDGLEVPEDCANDRKCWIVVKVNVIYDQNVNQGKGLTADQKKHFEQEQINRAQGDYATSNIILDVSYTAGSYTRGDDGKSYVTGSKPDALNVVVSDQTPNFRAAESGVDKNTGVAVTFLNFRMLDDFHAYPLGMSTTAHELGHQFLRHGYEPEGSGLDTWNKEYQVDNPLFRQSLGRSQHSFREGIKPRRYAVPLNPEANKPQP